MSLKITTLVENSLGENLALQAAHGLSFLIEKNEKKYLFDVAQHDLAIKNARELGIDLSQLDKVIISHNHYDHGGGLKNLINTFGPQEIIVHKQFFKEKYGVDKVKMEYLGINYTEEKLLSTGSKIEKVKDDITYISEDIFIAANFNRRTNFEKANDRFYIKEGGELVVDQFQDEIALGIESAQGLIILLGCSHPGVVNMIKSITEKTGTSEVYAVLGGTHLVEGDEEQINKTIQYFKDLEVNYVGVSHCTGDKAAEQFKSVLPARFFANNTGTSIEVTD